MVGPSTSVLKRTRSGPAPGSPLLETCRKTHKELSMSEKSQAMDKAKRDAAHKAVAAVESGMVVGLGTGSTANHAIQEIADALKNGRLQDIHGIPTSKRSQELGQSLGIPISTLDEHPNVDLTIDGADEVNPSGDLIKGGGGALLREKIVATATKRYIIIVDESKMVDTLGISFPLPVEVVKFGWKILVDPIREMGAEPNLRRDPTGGPFRTAADHYILDCAFKKGIPNPSELHQQLVLLPGVVETGLFVGMNPEVIVGKAGG